VIFEKVLGLGKVFIQLLSNSPLRKRREQRKITFQKIAPRSYEERGWGRVE